MRSKLLQFARFVNLLDHSGRLSITNLAVYIVLVKLAVLPTFSMPEVTAFLVAILGYSHKRFETNRAAKTASTALDAQVASVQAEVSSQIGTLRDEIGKLQMAAGFFQQSRK